ncbi:MAG: hypothetical protein KDE09_19700 [Anaerolineales bacterium]|nr:hypothetical protein [Anaerolineales bacterium]MCB0010444.1 hypothetical protein [Anaerolineales bacterium]MCB0020029.1 hypothetical protein [Anaerolineales bacterium]MCB8959677.1 pilus assembly protein CpaE [Ardenticatenales bacterium]
MIALELATQLKEAGLEWQPALHDFFSVPFPDLEHRVFVLSDMTINQEVLRGWPALTFSGAMEWALDYVLTMEVVWLPTEAQLRQQLIARSQPDEMTMTYNGGGYELVLSEEGYREHFSAETAEAVYGQALLAVLQRAG